MQVDYTPYLMKKTGAKLDEYDLRRLKFLKKITNKTKIPFIIKKDYKKIFTEWSKGNKVSYKEILLRKETKSQLYNDFFNAFTKAIIELPQKSDKVNIFAVFFDMGYVNGFVQGNLAVKWQNRYILKESDVYKELLVYKSLFHYFRVDKVMVLRLMKLYQYFEKEDDATISLEKNISPKKILDISEKNPNIGIRQFDKFISETISSDMTKKFMRSIDDSLVESCEPELNNMFSEQDIINIHLKYSDFISKKSVNN